MLTPDMMAFLMNDNLGLDSMTNLDEPRSYLSSGSSGSSTPAFHLISAKLEAPRTTGKISRPRLIDLLIRSSVRFSATVISGRAGTGKTVLAADFARTCISTAWYTIDSSDNDWKTFSRYFAASIIGPDYAPKKSRKRIDQTLIAEYLADVISKMEQKCSEKPTLIVLDDVHHLFDAEWFDDFFNLLIASLMADTHLLLLCRSKPPGPLWRMRSKQVLNLIDEKLLAFTQSEAEELFQSQGASREKARDAHRESFGRVSVLHRRLADCG